MRKTLEKKTEGWGGNLCFPSPLKYLERVIEIDKQFILKMK